MSLKQNKNQESTTRELDARISSLLSRELPKANDNHWFTPRVMNRLPEQSRWGRISIWQWICYLLGFVAFLAVIVISYSWLIQTDFSFVTILMVAFTSIMATICVGVMIVPSLINILREP